MAQQSMVSQLVDVLLLLHFLAFSRLMPTAAAQQETAWYAPDHCSEASSAQPPRSQCSADLELTIGDDWLVKTDCSSSYGVMVSYNDSSTHTIVDLGWESDIQVMVVRLECYPADRGAAGGIDQEEAKIICWNDRWQGQKLGGPYRFRNLSEAGILPGWTCNISTCFANTDEGIFYRNKVHSCTILPGGTAAETASITTASVPPTSESIALTDDELEDTTTATAVAVNATRAELITRTELDFNMNRENLNIYLPVILSSLGVAVLCVVLFVAVIVSSIRIQRQLARKKALLMYNKESMVFDPHFFPSVCIDKPATFGRSPMISMISINLLQNLDLPSNIYVKEHSASYLPMDDKRTSLNFETDTDDSDAGSIKLSHPTRALDTQRSKSSDDISSTRTEIIVESSEVLEKACPRSGGACREQSGVSLEQGYVQLPHYQQGPVLSPATITRLDCPSDDNDSVLTEVLSKGNEFKECTVAQLPAAKCSTSGYVQSNILHTACTAEKQEMHSTSDYMQSSGFSMPMSEGTHSNGGYIQSSAVSIPTESKEEPTNLLELLLNDETSESDDHDDNNPLIPATTATTEGCREPSVYFHPANLHSAISDYDNHCGHPKDILSSLNHTSTTDQQVELVHNSHSHSESPIVFHPPTTMDNEARPVSDASATCMQPSECEREHLTSPSPTPSSGVFTNSSTESAATTSTDPDSRTHGYIPSELFTRKILVPASQDSLPAAAAAAAGHGFVVHLDFENRHELLPRTINADLS